MTAGKTIAFALAATITLATAANAEPDKSKAEKKAEKTTEKTAETKAEKTADAKAEKKDAKADKTADAKADKTADAKAEKKADAKEQEKTEAPIASVADEPLWFEAPITVAAPAPAAKRGKDKKTKKKMTDEERAASLYGSVSLGDRASSSRPSVELEQRDKRPPLSHAAAVKVIRHNTAAVHYCQTRTFWDTGKRHRQMVLRFAVASDGTVSGISVTDSKNKPIAKVTACIARAMKRWSFPSGTRGGDIEYPLIIEDVSKAKRSVDKR